jgi:hypothetical protein
MSDIQISTFNAEQGPRVWAATLRVERMRDLQPQPPVINLPAPIVFRNDSGYEIPPYGCIQVTGTVEIGDQNYLLAGRPISWTGAVVGPFFFNSPRAVPDGEYGNCQPGPVFRTISDGTSLPVGVRVGPIASAFTVGKGCLYSVLGADDVATNCIRIVSNETPIIAIATTGIAANSSATVTKKDPAAGDWVAGTVTYTAWNPSGTIIPAAALVKCFPVDAKWSAVEIC